MEALTEKKPQTLDLDPVALISGCICGTRKWAAQDTLPISYPFMQETDSYRADKRCPYKDLSKIDVYENLLRASPTVLQISFAFMYLQKCLKNTYPTVWHLDFAILLTWQKERKDWHICQTCSHLALENWREVINVRPLEIVSFHLCHIILRLGKLSHLSNQLCKTVGDALRRYPNLVWLFEET